MMISGSLRGPSNNSALLRTAKTLMPDGFRGVDYEGMADLPHFNPDDDLDPLPESVIDLRTRIAESAGLVLCTPEYAGALPGSFKNLLDWTVGGIEIGDKQTAWINVSAPVVPSMVDSQGLVDDDRVRDGITRSLATLVEHVALVATRDTGWPFRDTRRLSRGGVGGGPPRPRQPGPGCVSCSSGRHRPRRPEP
ncbi:MAG: NADPH-dependent FMN reductase [Actinophytocola sp.]